MTEVSKSEWKRAAPVETVRIVAIDKGASRGRTDQVVGEEPLEIRVTAPGIEPGAVAVTMRTPGNDFELAAGFLLSEGIVDEPNEIRQVRYCDVGEDGVQRYNIVTAEVQSPLRLVSRRGTLNISSSCGICGTASLEELEIRCRPLAFGPKVRATALTRMPEHLRSNQRLFERTGGLHAAGLVRVETETMDAVREDVGRHNAVDKLGGWAAFGRKLSLTGYALVVSGRISFEIVQKAAIFGIPILVGVSAPTSLAIASAERLGMTLAGFVREERANLYAHPERVIFN